MIIDIPFVKNPDNFQCGQACVLMTLKYFYPKKKISFDDINKGIRYKPNKLTFQVQLAIALNYFGVKAKGFSKEDSPTGKKGVEAFKKWLGRDFDKIFNNWIDYPTYEWAVKTAKRKGLFKVKPTPFSAIERLFKEGYILIPVINWDVLSGVENKPYQGHFIIITGIDKDNVYINDPDVGKNLKFPKKHFIKAYTVPQITDDICVSYGKI